jgi:DNA polymerase (family 10)
MLATSLTLEDCPLTAWAVAGRLREYGHLLRISGANPHRAGAYGRAAAAIEEAADRFETLLSERRLAELRGIGSAIQRFIEEMAERGTTDQLDQLRRRFPAGVIALSGVMSLARARTLYDGFGIATLDALRAACEAGQLNDIPGFGPRSAERILERLVAQRRGLRLLLPEAVDHGDRVAHYLRGGLGIAQVEIAGDLRRRLETIDRLDVVVSAGDVSLAAEHVAAYPAAQAIVRQGQGEVVLQAAPRVDVRVRCVSPDQYGLALLDATGSVAHLSRLAARAATAGLTLGPQRLSRGSTRIAVRDETDVYEQLDLEFIPPELRADGSEVDAAETGALPRLIRPEQLRGIVHCHTTYSDGARSIEQMAIGAEALGMDYLTITDHSPTAHYANGLSLDRLRAQRDEIAAVQERVRVRILCGTESDILRDGGLDYPDAVLERLDVIIASVHNRYRLDAAQMTQRVIRAARHPLFKIWGHALGRYVLSRPPFECDVEAVLDAMAASPAAIEINGDPHRLDLAPQWIRRASARGIRFVISADAHSVPGLRNIRWGVDMARRGWVTAGEVLNTLPVEAFAAAVRPTGTRRWSVRGARRSPRSSASDGSSGRSGR